jgi:predicted HicB family RNase H-like nuclease
MNVMTYRGYSARVEFDPDDELFVGRLAGINDVVGFHAVSVAELKAAFHEAVDDYVETCRKIGKAPERPFSGKVMFRVAPEVHANAALAAQLAGKSLNQWGAEALEEASRQQLSGAEPRAAQLRIRKARRKDPPSIAMSGGQPAGEGSSRRRA